MAVWLVSLRLFSDVKVALWITVFCLPNVSRRSFWGASHAREPKRWSKQTARLVFGPSAIYVVFVSRLALASALSFGASFGCALFVVSAFLLTFEGP